MGLLDEPEILRASGNFTTNVVANTQTSDVLVAAPGVGSRLRIYWVSIGWLITAASPPPAVNNAIVGRIIQASAHLAISFPQQLADRVVFPMGAVMAANTQLNFVESATLASLNYYFGVGYVVESA